MSRRQADGAHERGAGDADAGQLGSSRPTVGDVPVDLERVRKDVAQEAEPRHLDGIAVAVGFDVKDFHLEHVAGVGASDEHRTGERVHHIQVRRGHRFKGRVRTHLAVECITRLEDDLVPRLAAQHRRDIRVPAVVTRARVLQKSLAPVNSDLTGGHTASLASIS